MCWKLGVSESGYYAWLKREKSQRQIEDEWLLEQIIRIHRGSGEVYGYPRVHRALQADGIKCGKNRVARIMRENGIKARMARRFRCHVHRHELFLGTTNLLLQREPVSEPNQVWVGDVTYIRVGTRWAYLSTVMDLYTRKIIGWSFSQKRDAALVREALLMARLENEPTVDTIFHSDQGSEYASKEYRSVIEALGLRVSMSRKGHCWDNAYMESFFGTLKTEMVYFQKFRHLSEAIAHIMEYIHFYNEERLHSSLGYIAPSQFEAKVA